jgi:hypothetical protein
MSNDLYYYESEIDERITHILRVILTVLAGFGLWALVKTIKRMVA